MLCRSRRGVSWAQGVVESGDRNGCRPGNPLHGQAFLDEMCYIVFISHAGCIGRATDGGLGTSLSKAGCHGTWAYLGRAYAEINTLYRLSTCLLRLQIAVLPREVMLDWWNIHNRSKNLGSQEDIHSYVTCLITVQCGICYGPLR